MEGETCGDGGSSLPPPSFPPPPPSVGAREAASEGGGEFREEVRGGEREPHVRVQDCCHVLDMGGGGLDTVIMTFLYGGCGPLDKRVATGLGRGWGC